MYRHTVNNLGFLIFQKKWLKAKLSTTFLVCININNIPDLGKSIRGNQLSDKKAEFLGTNKL